MTLVMDAVPGSPGGWSTRKLRSAYGGACLRVRRSSDNAEEDIGFDGNNIDKAALAAFVGAGNGFVTTWYDQSGNGFNATQATAVEQPQIVDDGTILEEDGRVVLLHNVGNQNLELLGGTARDIYRDRGFGYSFSVCRGDTTANQWAHVWTRFGSSNDPRFVLRSVEGRFNLGGRRLDGDSFQGIESDTTHDGQTRQVTGIIAWANASATLRENGVQTAHTSSFQTAGNTSDTRSNAVQISRDGGNTWIGTIAELIVYNTELTLPQVETVEDSQALWVPDTIDLPLLSAGQASTSLSLEVTRLLTLRSAGQSSAGLQLVIERLLPLQSAGVSTAAAELEVTRALRLQSAGESATSLDLISGTRVSGRVRKVGGWIHDDPPLEAKIYAINATANTVERTAVSAADGMWHMDLPAGTYHFAAELEHDGEKFNARSLPFLEVP